MTIDQGLYPLLRDIRKTLTDIELQADIVYPETLDIARIEIGIALIKTQTEALHNYLAKQAEQQ